MNPTLKALEGKRNWLALTVYRLCKRAGVSRSTYSSLLKRGNEPSWHIKRKLCRALSIDPHTLADIDNSKLVEHWVIPKDNGPMEEFWGWLCDEMHEYEELGWADEIDGLLDTMRQFQYIARKHNL